METINTWAVSVGDLCFGWLLWLPRGPAIALLALITALLAQAVRYACNVDDWQTRTRQDLRWLRRLLRQAKQAADIGELARHRANRARVLRLRCFHELRILFVALLPLLMIFTWAEERLSCLPHLPNQHVTLQLTTAPSDIGNLSHLVPADSITIRGGYVRRIEPTSVNDLPRGMTCWEVATDSSEPVQLMIRIGNRTLRHKLVTGRKPSPGVIRHGSQRTTTIARKQYSPWDLRLPGPGWLYIYVPCTVAFSMSMGLFWRLARQRRATAQMC